MPIDVKFFASLRERVGLSETTVDAAEVNSVQDVWQAATNNQAYAGAVEKLMGIEVPERAQ